MTRPSLLAFLPRKKLPLLAAPLGVDFDELVEAFPELGFEPGNLTGSLP
jgi:hypothetical protein